MYSYLLPGAGGERGATIAATPAQLEVDADHEYQEWVEKVLVEARRAVIEAGGIAAGGTVAAVVPVAAAPPVAAVAPIDRGRSYSLRLYDPGAAERQPLATCSLAVE